MTSATPPSPWSRSDWIAVVLVTITAGVLVFWRIGTPDEIVFDEVYYAQDACTLVDTEANCGVTGTFSKVHPLLGKWIIGAGIELFGYDPVGWRSFPAVAGMLSVTLLYVLARRLLGSTGWATFASGLLAVDGLHLVMSRVAMLDVFVMMFSLATFLFLVIDRDRKRSADERLRDRPWLFAAGLAGGAAMASKWSGIPFVGMAAIMALAWDQREARTSWGYPSFASAIRSRIGAVVVALGVVPLATYTFSFVGGLDGGYLAAPWDRGSWIRQFLGWQKHIATFGIDLRGVYPYTSPAWSWPLLKRPVVFSLQTGGDRFREVLALGNPVIWWLAVPAAVALAVTWARRRNSERPEGVILAGVAAGYLWWLPITSVRTFSFIFYLLPAVPFLCLALARTGQLIRPIVLGQAAAGLVSAAAIVLLAFFYPVLAAVPLEADAWTNRLWFTDCRAEALVGSPPRPQTVKTTTTPDGWCWI